MDWKPQSSDHLFHYTSDLPSDVHIRTPQLPLHNAESPSEDVTSPPTTYLKLCSDIATMGGGGKIPYPKHVWSPAGGWYSQPANWKGNTLIAGGALLGIGAILFSISAQIEKRPRMPEQGRFYPSR